MSYCGKCGAQLSDGTNFCPNCGARVSPVINDSDKKSPTKKTMISIVASLFVLVIAGGGWYFLKNNGEDYSLEKLASIINNYDYIQSFHDGLAVVSKDEKYGYINLVGEEVIPCKYDEARWFSDDFAAVNKDGKWGFINKKGNEKIPFTYDKVESFSNGLAAVMKNEKWGFVDKEGILAIPCIYDYAYSFSEDLACIEKDGKWGFIDPKGNIVIPFKYNNVGSFSEGLAFFYDDNRQGYINYKGKEMIILREEYERIGDFHDGLACVESAGGKLGFIDETGKMVIPQIYYAYRQAFGEFKDGFAIMCMEENCEFCAIDRFGKTIIPKGVRSYSEGLFCVYENDKFGFYDTKGECVIPSIYEEADDFSEGLAVVKKDGIYGIIDTKGNSTFDIENEEVKNLVNKKEAIKKQEELEERKRIEEENKPYNKFKSLINQNSYVWEAPVRGNRVSALYFYPLNDSMGKMSLVLYSNNFKSFSQRWSGNGTYRITENIIECDIEWYLFLNDFLDGRGSLDPRMKFLLRIENDGDAVKLIDDEENHDHIQKRIHIENPIKD